MAYTRALRQVAWPTEIQPCTTLKYDGTSNSREFLQIYFTAMTTTGADAKVTANWFPLALVPPARMWLMHLPYGTIGSCRELGEQFVSVFQGGYKRPGTMNDVHSIIQRPGEMLRHDVHHFYNASHNIPDVADAAIV